MKRAAIAAITAFAMAVPYFAAAQQTDAEKAAAIAVVKTKFAAAVTSDGEPRANPCSVINAADYNGKIQEAFCDGGLAYMIFPAEKGPAPIECASLTQSLDEKGELIVACRLPESRDPTKVVDQVLAETKTACTPVARDYVGESDTGSSVYFEVTCDNAKGYLVQVWKDPRDVTTYKNKVWICDDSFRSRGNECALTRQGVAGAKASEVKRLALIDAYFNPKPVAGKPAELAALPTSAPPPSAAGAGGVAAASAAAAAVSVEGMPDLGALTKAATAGGLNCPMNPPKPRGATSDGWVVEFRCTSKDDGRLGMFFKAPNKAPIIYNCALAAFIGVACLETKDKTAYNLLNNDIRRFDVSTRCKVAATRVMGVSQNGKEAYLEVKCDDARENGRIIQYDGLTLKPKEIINCADAEKDPNGRCRLPGAISGSAR